MRLSPQRRAHSSSKLATVSRWRAGGFQNAIIAKAPRTLVVKMCISFTDGGRLLFKMWISP
eukprot:4577048-Pyramimonas_sp.AAC.1